MQVFRNYLRERLSDPEFNTDYHKNCAICPLTVRIITAIEKSQERIEEIASQCGISAAIISDLESADKCCVESVKKLCDHFGIPQPEDCLQLRNL